MPVLPKAKAQGAGKAGRNSWEQGDKLWGNMVAHATSSFMQKYMAVPSFSDSGESSAIYQGLGEAQVWSCPDTLVQRLSAKSTELVNRPATGLSELAGCLETVNQAMKERPTAFYEKWAVLYLKHDVENASKCLNSHAYPNITRSEADLAKAVQQILKFSNDLRTQHWEALSQEMAVSATKVVGLSWAMEAASLTIPGSYAERLSSIKTQNKDAQTKMNATPQSGRLVRDFLAQEVKHLANTRSSSSAPVAQPAIVGQSMTFSDDEDAPSAAPAASAVPSEKKIFKGVIKEGLALELKRGIDKAKADKVMRKIQKTKEALKKAFEDWKAVQYESAVAFDQRPVREHFSKLKRKYENAFPAQDEEQEAAE